MTRRLRLWIWLAIALVLAGLMWFVPLFDVLGFEQAVVVAGFASICGLDLGAAHARWLQTARDAVIVRADEPDRALVRGVVGAAAMPVALVAIVGGIAAVHGLWRPTCDWWFGIEAYLLMPIASGALAGALGHLLAIVLGRGRWAAIACVVGPIALLVAAGLARFYGEPPVFVYNALIGFFPGNMYDENIVLGSALIWSRLEQLAWVIALACAVGAQLDVPTYRVKLRAPKPQRSLRFAAAAVAALAIAGLIHSSGGALGYAIDASDIQRELSGRIETAHFVIHYARTPEIEKDIELIARDHEFRYHQVVSQIGMAPEGKLVSYYFADTEQKARWFGARNVEMAKPWRHEIYLDHRSFPHTSLRHEIAHAVASSFGDRFFGVATRDIVKFNPGLIEGLAVALDWPGTDGPLTPHQSVRALSLMGIRPSIGDLLSIQFFEFSSARGYTTAGSFLRYLLDTYGPDKLRALYHNGGDFDEAYGKRLADLETDWRAMIDKIELPKAVVEATRERFRGGSVFSKPCPHAIAARRDAAFVELSHGDRDKAIALIREVCAEAPDEPRNRIDLAGVLITGDPFQRAEGTAIWSDIGADDNVTSTLRAEAFEKLARAGSDDRERLALIEKARALPVDGNERRQLDAEAFALAHVGAAGPPLRDYFFGAISSELMADAQHAADVEPELGFGHYLLGLQLANAGDWAPAADELDAALAHGLPNAAFVRFAARRLAVVAYRLGDRDKLHRAEDALTGPETDEIDHLLAKDWQAREAFDNDLHTRQE